MSICEPVLMAPLPPVRFSSVGEKSIQSVLVEPGSSLLTPAPLISVPSICTSFKSTNIL